MEFDENATLQIVQKAVIWDKIRNGEETYLNGTNTCHKFTVTTVLSSMAQWHKTRNSHNLTLLIHEERWLKTAECHNIITSLRFEGPS